MEQITHEASQWRALCQTCGLEPATATAAEAYIEVSRRALGMADAPRVLVLTDAPRPSWATAAGWVFASLPAQERER